MRSMISFGLLYLVACESDKSITGQNPAPKADIISRDNDFALSDSVTVGSGCSSLRFDGVDDYVTIPHAPSLNLSGDFSIGFWIQTFGAGTTGKAHWSILSKNSTGDGFNDAPLIFIADSSFKLGTRVSNGVLGTELGVYTQNRFDDGRWRHVFVVGDLTNKSVSVYVNGILSSSGDYSHSNFVTNTANLTLGNREAYGNFFNGKITDLAIFSSALSPNEVYDLYAGNQDETSFSSLVSSWAFSGVSNTTLFDNHINANHGNISGATFITSCPEEDLDADGVAAWEDCDDNDRSVNSTS